MALKWLEKLGGDKKERILILLLAGVLLLVIVIPTGQEGGEMTETGDSVQVVSDDTGRTKEEALEQRLAAVLAQAGRNRKSRGHDYPEIRRQTDCGKGYGAAAGHY